MFPRNAAVTKILLLRQTRNLSSMRIQASNKMTVTAAVFKGTIKMLLLCELICTDTHTYTYVLFSPTQFLLTCSVQFSKPEHWWRREERWRRRNKDLNEVIEMTPIFDFSTILFFYKAQPFDNYLWFVGRWDMFCSGRWTKITSNPAGFHLTQENVGYLVCVFSVTHILHLFRRLNIANFLDILFL